VADALNPDVVFVDAWIGALGGSQPSVARALRDAGAITPATPVLAFSIDPLTREERLAALDGGVWDVVELPFDPPVLRLRLDSWLAGKRFADRLERANLHDREAPMYNLRGLLSRARELGADAARGGTPLACVAIGAAPTRRAADDVVSARAEEAVEGDRLRAAWTASGRASDVIGRVGRAEFVVLAPRTGAAGARVLADRLCRALDGHPGALRTTVVALEPTPSGPDDAIALVGRAMATLQRRHTALAAAPSTVVC
jgi:PleD family two-component response regulator